MRKSLLVALPAVLAWLASPGYTQAVPAQGGTAPRAAAAGVRELRLDPAHAHVGFAVRHLGIATVRGRFAEASGRAQFDPEDVTRSSVEVRINAASVDTENERRDEDLRTNFLEVEKHPEILFRSRRITREGDGYRMTGDLTLHGVTREVSFPFQLAGPAKAPGNLERMGVEAALVIDRRDYGITLSRVFETGALVVGNEVRINLDVEFGRRLAEAAPPTR